MLPSSLFASLRNPVNTSEGDNASAEESILSMLRAVGGQSLVDSVKANIAEGNAKREAMRSAPCTACRSTGVLRMGFRPEPPKPRRRNGKMITPVMVSQEVQFEDYVCPQCQGTNFGFPILSWEAVHDNS
jgi:hypothetical protein